MRRHSAAPCALEATSLASAILNNGLCRYGEALSAARAVDDSSWYQQVARAELVEATSRTEATELAVEVLDRLSADVVAGSD